MHDSSFVKVVDSLNNLTNNKASVFFCVGSSLVQVSTSTHLHYDCDVIVVIILDFIDSQDWVVCEISRVNRP